MEHQTEVPAGVTPLVFITTTVNQCIVPRPWPMRAAFSTGFLQARAHPAFVLDGNRIKVEVHNGSAIYEFEELTPVLGIPGSIVIAKLLTPTAIFREPEVG